MRVACLIGFVALAACGGTSVERPVASAPPPAAAPRPAAPPLVAPLRAAPATAPLAVARVEVTSAEVPSAPVAANPAGECANADDVMCTPAPEVVKQLCDGRPRQDLTLTLFNKGTPFTRFYLRGKYDELSFDEEVLALGRSERSPGGLVVGGETYDVLRWDGSCARGVQAEMLTKTVPPKPRAARLHWSWMNEPLQISLIVASQKIKSAHARQGKECMGASFSVTPACGKASDALSYAIVDYVRKVGASRAPALPVASR